MAGPQEDRLRQALSGAHPTSASGGADEWRNCAVILENVSRSLLTAKMPIEPGDAGGKTAAAMDASFHKSAEAMAKRATKLSEGAVALTDASEVIAKAHDAYTGLGPEKSAPTYTPHENPHSPEGIKQHKAYLSDLAAYNADQQHREAVAKQHADRMDAVFKASSATMKEIHGIPDPPPAPKGYAGGGGSTTGGTSSTTVPHSTVPTGPGGPHGNTVADPPTPHPGSDPGTDPGPGYTPGPGSHPATPWAPGGGDGTPQDNSPTNPIPPFGGGGGGAGAGTPGGAGSGSAGGLTGGAGLGLAGAATGGLGGGLLSTGLAGGVRGGMPILANGGTAASGVRGIGSTARTGVSGTLGRTGVAATGSGSGTSTRGAGTRSGAVAGRGATGRGGAGSRGTAGRRGSAAGSTAGGRGGRSKDDEKKKRQVELDDVEDWIDDEEAAPGVIS